MKKLLLGIIMGLFATTANAANIPNHVYDFSFTTLTGNQPLPLKQFEGKVMLIVNTASECRFTKQYEGLETLYRNYKEKGLVIIGVPTNEFGGQEPGSNEDIAAFCKKNYGVSFPMASKEIVSGEKAHPFYLYARKVLGFGTGPKWNFHKYLVNRKGEVVDYFHSTTGPDDERLVMAIEKLL